MSKSVNLIARDNGAGLSRDIRLLADLLTQAGHRVSVTRLGHRGRLSNRFRLLYAKLRGMVSRLSHGKLRHRYDINVMIEQVRPELFDQAKFNVLLPNPEWFRKEWLPELTHFDAVLCKTRHAQQLFDQLGTRTLFVGFTSDDRQQADVPRQHGFFHGPGRSGNKGTLPLLQLWAKHPEWPPLMVVWRRKRVELPPLPANVTVLRHYLEDTELRRLQNTYRFHLCPSQTEGYGHSIAESLSTGAVTITLDAEPMNELVTPERGVLVHARATGHQQLATLYDFDEPAMAAAVEHCMTINEQECARLGNTARQWFIDNSRAFTRQLLEAIETIHPRE